MIFLFLQYNFTGMKDELLYFNYIIPNVKNKCGFLFINDKNILMALFGEKASV